MGINQLEKVTIIYENDAGDTVVVSGAISNLVGFANLVSMAAKGATFGISHAEFVTETGEILKPEWA